MNRRQLFRFFGGAAVAPVAAAVPMPAIATTPTFPQWVEGPWTAFIHPIKADIEVDFGLTEQQLQSIAK